MSNETIKVNGSECINITVTPLTGDNERPPVVEVKADDFLNQFSDEPLTKDPNAKKKLSSMIDYLKSSRFKKDINTVAYKTGVPPKQVAKGAISKAFGILGDILGIVVDTASCTLNGLVDLLSSLLHKGIELITRVVNGLCRVITFNQTCCA